MAKKSHRARTGSRNGTESRKVSFYVITTRVAKKFFPQPMKGKSVTISSLNGSGAVKASVKFSPDRMERKHFLTSFDLNRFIIHSNFFFRTLTLFPCFHSYKVHILAAIRERKFLVRSFPLA